MSSSLRLVLASASPARLQTLRAAGLDPEVIVSGVQEDGVSADSVPDLVRTLARLKAEAVHTAISGGSAGSVVIGCDSMLELDGTGHGKPRSAAEAVQRWRRMSGRTGVLHTGHHVIWSRDEQTAFRSEVASTTVHFARLSEPEIAAYVASGEPLQVAGAFTVDGLGGPFVSGIEGDHHNVVGIGLPLLRLMLADLGLAWTGLWPSGAG